MEYCNAVRDKDKCFMEKSKRTNSIRSRKNDNTKERRKERRHFSIAGNLYFLLQFLLTDYNFHTIGVCLKKQTKDKLRHYLKILHSICF